RARGPGSERAGGPEGEVYRARGHTGRPRSSPTHRRIPPAARRSPRRATLPPALVLRPGNIPPGFPPARPYNRPMGLEAIAAGLGALLIGAVAVVAYLLRDRARLADRLEQATRQAHDHEGGAARLAE